MAQPLKRIHHAYLLNHEINSTGCLEIPALRDATVRVTSILPKTSYGHAPRWVAHSLLELILNFNTQKGGKPCTQASRVEERVPDVHNSHLLGIRLAFDLKLDISGALFILLGIASFSFLSSLLYFFFQMSLTNFIYFSPLRTIFRDS